MGSPAEKAGIHFKWDLTTGRGTSSKGYFATFLSNYLVVGPMIARAQSQVRD